MANLISLPVFNTAIDDTGVYAASTSVMLLNVSRIISVKTLTGSAIVNSTGVTAINYQYQVNNANRQASVITTQTTAQVLALANAPLA